MSVDETEIYEYLKRLPTVYVSVIEISKSVGNRRNFLVDRVWARPILRRMEMEGLLESNPHGEYRLKNASGDTTTFLQALNQPGVSLGDTTIITLGDVQRMEREREEAKKAGQGGR